MTWLDDPHFHNAFWTITVAGMCSVSCSLLGCFLLIKRLSLLGDAISHGVLPGIALMAMLTGQITGVPLLIGAMVFGVLTAVLTQALTSLGRVPEDASMGVVFTSLFALGIILITKFLGDVDLDPNCVFFGLLEGVPLRTFPFLGVEIPDALPTMAITLLVITGFLAVFWKELVLAAFDEALAQAMGFWPSFLNYALIALVAACTVSSFEAIGSVLVLAMLIVPPATANLLTDRMFPMLLWSVVFALSCAILGYVFAVVGPFSCNIAGMMAVVAGVQFTLVLLLAPQHGIVMRIWRNVQLSLRIAGEEILATLYRAEEKGTPSYALALKEHSLPPWIQRLAQRNLLRWKLLILRDDGLLALTVKGKRLAQSIIRSHRLWEAYVGEVLDLPADHVHAPASRMEHFIGPELQQQLAETLHEPPHDPHGQAIPPTPPPS